MDDFRSGKTTVLITTNVLARGIDVLQVSQSATASAVSLLLALMTTCPLASCSACVSSTCLLPCPCCLPQPAHRLDFFCKLTPCALDDCQVTMVVNYDVPLKRDNTPDPETYIHRIGRSGRFGRQGVSAPVCLSCRVLVVATRFACLRSGLLLCSPLVPRRCLLAADFGSLCRL